MPNVFDQFDPTSELKDLATSFGVGSNQLLKMGGDAYGLATGNMGNAVSRLGQENIDYLQRGKSKNLTDAETRRKAAVDAKSGIVDQALAYAKETFTDPRLLLSSTVEAIPSMIGAGGIGAGARAVTGRVLAKKGAEKAAEIATKVGVGTAVAAGSGMQGTSVGAEQYGEVADILSKMPDEKAMEVPEIARLMSANGYSLEKAKEELTLNLARSTGALAGIASLATQIVPGGRTIEGAIVGGAGKKLPLAQRGLGVVRGLLGESIQEGSEEGSGAAIKNVVARAVEPERDITEGVGAAIGGGVAGTALIGAGAGGVSHSPRQSEATAGKPEDLATRDITVLEATTDHPRVSLGQIEDMSPEEFAAAINLRDALSRGGKPSSEDIATVEGMRLPPDTQKVEASVPVQDAINEWVSQNPDAGIKITAINDPNLRNSRNYGIRGYFDPNTGDVVINSAFVKSFDVESIIHHEWAHHTLSSEEGKSAIVDFATRDIPKEELDALAKRYPNADSLTLVEEWIARNQETFPGIFDSIIAKIREWLNGKFGINMTNEEAARAMLRTLRDRGAAVAEEGGEMRQSTTEQPISVSERRAEALRAFKERNPLSDAVMDKGRLSSPKVRDRLKTLRSTGVVDRQALDSDIETNFPAASRVEIPTEDTLPTLDEIRSAVDEPKRSKVGGAVNIPEGDLIEVRQDVPAYTNNGVGVVTVRDSKGNTYYQPMVRFTDPVLKPTPREENTALRIGSGENKNPTIVVEGKMASDQSMPPDIDTWTQVGYNPDRHSYMYDRETGDPVLSGSEAVQIGNTVFVKDPEFGQREDFKYSVEDEPRSSGIMASPSITDIDYSRSKRNLTSSDQARFRSQVKDYAPDAAIYNAVGDWRDGAENSVAAIFDTAMPTADLEQLAAKAGLAGDQKAVLWWTTNPNGADAIHRVTWPKDVTMDQARQAMIDAGLENRTLIETPDGVQGFVFDQGQQNLNKITDLHENPTEPSISTQRATGDFLGSWNTRVEGKRAYRSVLGRAAKTETGDRGGQYDQRTGGESEARDSVTDELVPERSSVLAKQPIRESLTDDPVERVPEEGDPDYEEPVDTSSVLSAPAKRRERDDLPPTSALNTLYAKDSSIPLPSQGKRTNGQVAAQLREAAREHWGRDLDSSNITPEEIDRVVTNGVEEVLAGLKASNHAGNWYTTAIRKAMAIAGILHPELNDDALAQKAGFKDAHAAEVGLATAMAITSQNLNVQKNTQYANEQFNILKRTGRFDPSKEYGSKLEAVSGNLSLANAMLDRVGWDGMEDFLNREYTVRELNDVASKLLGRKINISGKVDDVVNGSAIFGPKIGGGFFQNLRGNFNPVTVDLWMRRTWGRWTGDVLPDPLDAKRLARMIDGMRESGIPLPEELRSLRTITAKSGRKVSTLSDAAAERVLSNPEAVTAAYDFAAQQDSRWNKIYSEVRQNITPQQAEAVRNGSLSLEKLNRDQQKSIREKKTAWQDLEDRPSSSSKEGKLAQEKLFAEMDEAAGRTAILTNEELSDNKPEWAKSSRVIKTLLKPVDVPSDIDRRVIVDVVNRIRNELDRQGVTATNADIQAILWYPEKDLWAKLAGKKESNLKNSYDEEFLKVAQSQGLGERARAAAARVGDAAP